MQLSKDTPLVLSQLKHAYKIYYIKNIQNQELLSWYISRSPLDRLKLHRIDMNLKCVADLVGIIQYVLVVKPEAVFSQALLEWNVDGTSIKLSNSQTLKSKELLCNPRHIELTKLIRINWYMDKPIDIYVARCDLLSYMSDVSCNQCFKVKPNSFSTISIHWLKNKALFSFSELIVALIELNIWRHHCEGLQRARSSPGSSMVDPMTISLPPVANDMLCNIERVLFHYNEQAMLCSISGQIVFRHLVYQISLLSIRHIIKDKDKKIKSILLIMKKRLKYMESNIQTNPYLEHSHSRRSSLCSCYQPNPPLPAFDDGEKLWCLQDLLSLAYCQSSISFHMDEASIPSDDMSVIDGYRPHALRLVEYIHELLGVPLWENYTLRHELQMLVKNKLLEIGATLLSKELQEQEDIVENKGLKLERSRSSRSAGKKKKRKKCSSTASQSKTEAESISVDGEAEFKKSSEFHQLSINPRDVTHKHVNYTQMRVYVGSILEDIFDLAWVVVSDRAIECDNRTNKMTRKKNQKYNKVVEKNANRNAEDFRGGGTESVKGMTDKEEHDASVHVTFVKEGEDDHGLQLEANLSMERSDVEISIGYLHSSLEEDVTNIFPDDLSKDEYIESYGDNTKDFSVLVHRPPPQNTPAATFDAVSSSYSQSPSVGHLIHTTPGGFSSAPHAVPDFFHQVQSYQHSPPQYPNSLQQQQQQQQQQYAFSSSGVGIPFQIGGTNPYPQFSYIDELDANHNDGTTASYHAALWSYHSMPHYQFQQQQQSLPQQQHQLDEFILNNILENIEFAELINGSFVDVDDSDDELHHANGNAKESKSPEQQHSGISNTTPNVIANAENSVKSPITTEYGSSARSELMYASALSVSDVPNLSRDHTLIDDNERARMKINADMHANKSNTRNTIRPLSAKSFLTGHSTATIHNSVDQEENDFDNLKLPSRQRSKSENKYLPSLKLREDLFMKSGSLVDQSEAAMVMPKSVVEYRQRIACKDNSPNMYSVPSLSEDKCLEQYGQDCFGDIALDNKSHLATDVRSESCESSSDENCSTNVGNSISPGMPSLKSLKFPPALASHSVPLVSAAPNHFIINNSSQDSPLVVTLSCICLRSQVDSAVLRNIVALQKSLIWSSHVAYHPHPDLSIYSLPQHQHHLNSSPESSYGLLPRTHEVYPNSAMSTKSMEVLSESGDRHNSPYFLAGASGSAMSTPVFTPATHSYGIHSPARVKAISSSKSSKAPLSDIAKQVKRRLSESIHDNWWMGLHRKNIPQNVGESADHNSAGFLSHGSYGDLDSAVLVKAPTNIYNLQQRSDIQERLLAKNDSFVRHSFDDDVIVRVAHKSFVLQSHASHSPLSASKLAIDRDASQGAVNDSVATDSANSTKDGEMVSDLQEGTMHHPRLQKSTSFSQENAVVSLMTSKDDADAMNNSTTSNNFMRDKTKSQQARSHKLPATNSLSTPLPGHSKNANTSPSIPVIELTLNSVCGSGHFISPLTREIMLFVSSNDEFNRNQRRLKTIAIERMRQAIKSLWPRAQVKAFGSFVSGLSLPSSDLDLVICLPKVQREAGPEAPGALEGRNAIKETWQQHLARYLRTEDWVNINTIKVIPNTAVPVIKFRTLPLLDDSSTKGIGIDEVGNVVCVDVSFEGVGHQGLEANKLNISLLREFPSLRSLVLILKCFLSNKGLCEAFTGGLSSYAILLLCTKFLQEQPPGLNLDIGALLLGILNFYGNHFQPAVTGISVFRKYYFARSMLSPYAASSSSVALNAPHNSGGNNNTMPSYKPYKFDPLFIEDPLNCGNNVGRNCFRIQQVQRVCSQAFSALMEQLSLMETHGQWVPLVNILVGVDNASSDYKDKNTTKENLLGFNKLKPTYKEFVPGTGLVSGGAGSGTPEKNSNIKSSDGFADLSPALSKFMSRNSSSLPYWSPDTKIGNFSIENDESQTIGNMNAEASEWVPPNFSENPDEMVQVSMHGNVFFVPQHLAQNYDTPFVPTTSDEIVANEQSLPTASKPLSTRSSDWLQNSASTVPAPPRRTIVSIGLPEEIRSHLQALDLETLKQMDPSDQRYKEIPPRFYNAYPLDDPTVNKNGTGSYGYPSAMYKVIDRLDNQLYVLRRFDNVRITNNNPAILKKSLDQWKPIRHTSLVPLHLIHNEKGAVFFIYGYYTMAETVKKKYMVDTSPNLLPESIVWKMLCQVLVCIRFVHSKKSALRCINSSSILHTPDNKFHINNVGILDVLEFESRKSVADMQAEDLIRLGHVVLAMLTKTNISTKHVNNALAFIQENYSNELYRMVFTLLNGQIIAEYEIALEKSETLYTLLRSQYENSRMVRLLLKLGLVNERPEHATSSSWSETGDRYVLKLFRDYLFHQCDSNGVPNLDMGHVISALNKLDVGDEEKILLSSRDGKDILVVSFQDIKRCIEVAIQDLTHQVEAGISSFPNTTQSAARVGGGAANMTASSSSQLSQSAPVYRVSGGGGVAQSGRSAYPYPYGESSSDTNNNFSRNAQPFVPSRGQVAGASGAGGGYGLDPRGSVAYAPRHSVGPSHAPPSGLYRGSASGQWNPNASNASSDMMYR